MPPASRVEGRSSAVQAIEHQQRRAVPGPHRLEGRGPRIGPLALDLADPGFGLVEGFASPLDVVPGDGQGAPGPMLGVEDVQGRGQGVSTALTPVFLSLRDSGLQCQPCIGDHMLQGDNYLYHGIAVQRKTPAAPYAIVYSAPAMGFAGVAAINRNTARPYAAALWTDWTLTEESQKYVASSLLRGPVALKHPYLPDSMKIVTYNDAPADVSKRLLDTWNRHVAKRR